MKTMLLVFAGAIALWGQCGPGQQIAPLPFKDKTCINTPQVVVSAPIAVSALPAASSQNANQILVVSNTTNCTSTSGTLPALCMSTGAAWVPVGGGGSGGSVLPSLTVGSGTGQFTLSMKDAATGTDSFGVPFFRSTGSNVPTALDLAPSGTPTDVGYGYAWNDICDTDILNADGSQNVDCLHLSAGSTQITVASASYGANTPKPLMLGVSASPNALVSPAMFIFPSTGVFVGPSAAGNDPGSGNLHVTGTFQSGGNDTIGGYMYAAGRGVFGNAAPYSSGGQLDIMKSSTYTTEAAGLTIGTANGGSGVGYPELLAGTDPANTLAYIQSATRGQSFTNMPLQLNPNGGPVNINKGANVVYRCTTAGTLPVGALTIVTADCSASTDTGLRVP